MFLLKALSCNIWSQVVICFYLEPLTARLMITDSNMSLKTSKMWLNTMKVKLLCMDSLSSKKTHGWCSGAGASGDITLPQRWAPFLPLQMSPAQTDRPDDSGGRHTHITGLQAGILHLKLTRLGVFFFFFTQFTSIKLSLTLMSGPPGDMCSGQQVQTQDSPAAVAYLLTNHCRSNKPKHCGKLHSDIRFADLHLISKH